MNTDDKTKPIAIFSGTQWAAPRISEGLYSGGIIMKTQRIDHTPTYRNGRTGGLAGCGRLPLINTY